MVAVVSGSGRGNGDGNWGQGVLMRYRSEIEF